MHDSPEDKKIVESIKHHYLNILEREPDDMGLRSYLKQIKDNTINIDDLPKILKESEEYEWVNPVETNGESLEQKIASYPQQFSNNKNVINIVFFLNFIT